MSETVLLVGGPAAGVDAGLGWQALPCPTTADALAVLDEPSGDPVGAVVALDMPGQTGVNLLAQLRVEYPGVARLLVSGQAGLDVALRAADLAHQVLPAPADGPRLCAALDRVMASRGLLHNEELQKLAGSAEGLPSPPRVFAELTAVLESPSCTTAEIASVIRTDPAVAAKVLQLVNSSFFGLARQVADVRQAVAYLGSAMIRSLVLSTEAMSLFRAPAIAAGLDAEALQAHAVATAALASELAPPAARSDAFAAGLLADSGLLLLAGKAPERLLQPEEQWGFTHAELGGFLLTLWGLPTPVVEAVAFHHNSFDLPHVAYEVVDAVHLAGEVSLGDVPSPELVQHLLGLHGLTDAARARLDG